MKGKIAYLIEDLFEPEESLFYEEHRVPEYRLANPNKFKRIVYFEVA